MERNAEFWRSSLAAEGGTTPLWRAVTQAELKDLGANAGAFRNPFGTEVKYFSETAEGAASCARQTFQAGGSLRSWGRTMASVGASTN